MATPASEQLGPVALGDRLPLDDNVPLHDHLTLHDAAGLADRPWSPEPVDGHLQSRRRLAERTHELLVQAADADPATRQACLDEVVTSHLWLARTICRRFLHRGEDEDDLWQVACIGLVEAARRSDPHQGPFIPFASSTISGLLKRHFRDHGWVIRPPRRTQELQLRMWRQWPDLAQSVAGIPRDDQLAARLGESRAEIQLAQRAGDCYRLLSLDHSPAVQAAVPPAEQRELDSVEAHLIVAAALTQLTAEECRLLRLRFFEDRSQAEIAEVLGTSQMQVSRLLARLLRKLRTIVGPLDGDGGADALAQAS